MGAFTGDINAGSTDVSVNVTLRELDETEVTGLLAASVTVDYWRQGDVPVNVPLSDIALTDPHQDGGFVEAAGGAYRLDLPDAAFAQGSDWVDVIVNTATSRVFHERFNLKR